MVKRWWWRTPGEHSKAEGIRAKDLEDVFEGQKTGGRRGSPSWVRCEQGKGEMIKRGVAGRVQTDCKCRWEVTAAQGQRTHEP